MNSKLWTFRFVGLHAVVGLALLLGACTDSTEREPQTVPPSISTTTTVPTTVPPTTTTTTTVAPIDPPPIGEAYVAAISADCNEFLLCQEQWRIGWITVSPGHSDHDEAVESIRQAFPDAQIVDPDVADGYPWTGTVLNVARIDDRSNPLAVTVRLAYDTDRRKPLPCTDVFVTTYTGEDWQQADPTWVDVDAPIADQYRDDDCEQAWPIGQA